MNRFALGAFLAISVFFIPKNASGQQYTFESYGKEVAKAKSMAPQPSGFGQFGEDIDLNSGSVSFRKTLVELQGNNSLRVSAEFIFGLTDRLDSTPVYEWRKALPYIQGIHSIEIGWQVGSPSNYTGQRCSHSARLGVASVARSSKPPRDNFIPEDYWEGSQLIGVKGGGLIRQYLVGEPTIDGQSVLWATNGGWRFTCYALSDGTEGFVGHSPDGMKYYFGIPVEGDEQRWVKSNFHYDAETYLEVALYKMYLTRVEDGLGNWVNYTASQITSSDGRIIAFESNAGGMIVRANGKAWTISAVGSGVSISNPDASIWSISQVGSIGLNYTTPSSTCVSQALLPSSYSGQTVITVSLESGA